MRFSFLFSIFFVFSTLLISEGNYNSQIYINDIKLNVEIAETEYQRAFGLMYRESMPDSCGMLFVFPESDFLSFWMKNTLIPLSIAFIDESGKIINIEKMEPHNLESVRSSECALYALEVNQGWFSKNNIKVGDRVEF